MLLLNLYFTQDSIPHCACVYAMMFPNLEESFPKRMKQQRHVNVHRSGRTTGCDGFHTLLSTNCTHLPTWGLVVCACRSHFLRREKELPQALYSFPYRLDLYWENSRSAYGRTTRRLQPGRLLSTHKHTQHMESPVVRWHWWRVLDGIISQLNSHTRGEVRLIWPP